MPSQKMVLIIWSDGFDELAATAFTTLLRKAGVRVSLVGLTRTRAAGANGLALVPDITLEQAGALADHAAAVILPAGEGAVRRLGDDPRVRELIDRACANRALLITSAGGVSEVTALVGDASAPPPVATYSDSCAAINFTDRLVERWDRWSDILPDESKIWNPNC